MQIAQKFFGKIGSEILEFWKEKVFCTGVLRINTRHFIDSRTEMVVSEFSD